MWLYRNKQRLLKLQIVILPLLTVAAVIAEPGNVIHPLSPITFNIALIVLSIVGLMMSKDVPTAKSKEI